MTRLSVKILFYHRPVHQWSVPTTQQTTLTGGPNYQRPHVLQSTTLPPTGAVGQPVDWNRGVFSNHFPQPQMAPQPQMYGMVSEIPLTIINY